MTNRPFYVLLIADCEDDKTGKHKALEAHFKFASEELWELYCDHSFDDLIDDFNDWLSKNGHKGWYVDDGIETVRRLTESEAVSPVVVTE